MPGKSNEPKQYEAKEGAFFYITCDRSKSNPKASFTWVLKDEGGGKTSTPVETNDRVVVAGDGTYTSTSILG